MHTARPMPRLLWLVPMFGLLACAKKEADANAAAAPAMQAPAPPPPPAPVSVTLTAKNNSKITGTAVLTKQGDSTSVALTLDGGRSGTTYPSHIHAGTCAKPGEVVAPLASVKVGADKSGTSTTVLATSVLDSARTKYGSLLEQSHLPNGKPVACGEIPAQ